MHVSYFKYFIFLFFLTTHVSHAETAHINHYVPQAKLVGKTNLSYLWFDVYDIALYAPKGKWQQNQPFALKLDYQRLLYGDKIADRSIEEMRKQGFNNKKKLERWLKQMERIFPDVDKGISLTAIRSKNGNSVFYKNNKKIGEINDKEFTRQFFNIWLGKKTSEPRMRKRLLNL